MAPPPEYDKEPKAPDKSATNISTEDSKLLHNLINDQHTNSDHKPANTAAAVEVENNKHVETLDDGQLRALLDEAITYKCPKDREGKSSLFKELLEEVEQDEQACEAAARTLSGGRTARRGARGRRALPHSNSLQDLVAALAAEPAPRRAHVRHHAPAPAPSSVSARAIHGGSLPCGVDTSSLLSEEPARAGYLATVRCVNPPPLTERRVSASDANTPSEMELLNRRSKPMFPMTYTARATLEIGSGAVCSGRAVTTTTPSNQVRSPPQARLLRALRAPQHATHHDAPKCENNKPRGPNLLNQRLDKEDKRRSSKSDRTDKGSTAKITRDEHRPDSSQLWADNVDNWYKGLANYTNPLQYANSIKLKDRNVQTKVTDTPSSSKNIESTNMENNFVLPFAIASVNKHSPDSDVKDDFNHNIISDLPTKDKINKKVKESKKNSYLRHYDKGSHRVVENFDYDKQCDIKLREKYRQQVGAKLVRPTMSDINPRNVRPMTIGHRSLSQINQTSYFIEEHDKEKLPQKTIKKVAERRRSYEIDSTTNLTLHDVTSELMNIEDINSSKSNQLFDTSTKCYNSSDEGEDITITNPFIDLENSKSQGGEVELTDVNPSHSRNINIDDSFAEYVSKQQKLLESISNSEESNCVTITREYETEEMCRGTNIPEDFKITGHAKQECSKTKVLTNKQDENTTKSENIHTMSSDSEHITKPDDEHTSNSEVGPTRNPEVEHTKKHEVERTTNPEVEHTRNHEVEHTTNLELERTTNPEVERTTNPEVEHTTNPEVEHTTNPELEHKTNFEVEHIPNPELKHTTNCEIEHTMHPEVEHGTKSDRIILTQLPNNAYIFLTLPKPLVSLSDSNVNTPVQLIEIENNNDTKPLVSENNRPNIVKKKRQKMPPEHPGSSDTKKSALDKNVLKLLLFENLFKNNSGENVPPNSGVSAITNHEVDSAISFSCITTPEVVSSCNTTSSTAQSALAVDPKPRSVISSSFNGLPLSRPNYGSTGTSASDDYKKSLDENGNSVQGFSSPLSGSSQHKKPRRKKSSKNETVIDCQQIDGYQGDKDVNELLRFIESNADNGRGAKLGRVKHKDDSDDKSGKKRSTERRKDKENKIKRASSLEELSRTKIEDLTDVAEAPLRGDKKERRDQPAKVERRSWGDDALYSDVPDTAAAAELTDFQTVTKKRKPRRRPDDAPPRRARAPSPRRQESAPPSERSNDSNDDMDSVHSLPAAPLPAPPPPPPPPPVASYADIARTRHNIPDLIESCNFYAEGPAPAAAAAADADGYPALAARRRDKAARARKPAAAASPPSPPSPAPDVPAPDVVQDRRPPVILLDEAQRPRDMDGVTFGFELNEQLLGGLARRPRCDLLRDAPDQALPVRAGALQLRYVPPDPPADTQQLLQIVDYVGAAWDDVLRCGGGKVRYFSE